MIYLMRHGQDDETYIGGWSGVSLTSDGIEEVKSTAIWLRDNLSIKSIQSSDVKRAVETARIVSSYLNVPFCLNSNLREQNKGSLNGVLRTELTDFDRQFVESIDVNLIYPNGESLKDLYIRIKSYLSEIMKMSDDTLLITHRGVINMIYYILYDKTLDMNKKQFGVSTASVHEIDTDLKIIKKVR